MDIGYSHAASQRVLKQRDLLLGAVGVLALLLSVLTLTAFSRDREVVLQPVLRSPVTISSAGVSKEYLEMVTRDTAYLMLNRNPQSLDYWMKAVLEIVHPSAYGRLRGELVKIVDEQRGTSIAQFFTMQSMKIDSDNLVSEVKGTLHTMVGREEVSAVEKTFRFRWTYTGLSLRLIGFAMVAKDKPEGRAE